MTDLDGMETAKLALRREREFQAQIKEHGGTGSPPDTPDDEAIRQSICPKCSGRWDALHTHVWKHYEKHLREQGVARDFLMPEGIRLFREEFNYDGPLVSVRQKETQRQAQLARMRGAQGDEIKTRIATALSRPRPDLRGRTGVNPSGWSPPDWEVAKSIASGRGHVETAKKLSGIKKPSAEQIERMQRLVGRRAASMDLAREAPFLCDCGSFFSNGSLFEIRRASGFETSEWDGFVGFSEGRSQATRPRDSLANPEDARFAVEWRDGVIAKLLEISAISHHGLRLGEKTYSQERVLKTFLPDLPKVNRALVGTMDEIQQAAREHPEWGVQQLGNFVCEQASVERAADSEDARWRTSLKYLATRESFLANNLARLRGADKPGPIIRELIGSSHGAHQYTVQNALRDETETIPPHEMRMLIKEFAPTFAKPKPKQGGAPSGIRADTEKRIRRIAGLEMARPRWTRQRMAPFVFWDKPASCQENIRPFVSSYRLEIGDVKSKLTEKEVQQIVEEANQFLAKTPRS